MSGEDGMVSRWEWEVSGSGDDGDGLLSEGRGEDNFIPDDKDEEIPF